MIYALGTSAEEGWGYYTDNWGGPEQEEFEEMLGENDLYELPHDNGHSLCHKAMDVTATNNRFSTNCGTGEAYATDCVFQEDQKDGRA